MNCPSCSTELKLSDRAGIEIDYCPACRGVWLDRGELDKILDRTTAGPRRGRDEDDDSRVEDADATDRRQGRGSWLSEMFDFGD